MKTLFVLISLLSSTVFAQFHHESELSLSLNNSDTLSESKDLETWNAKQITSYKFDNNVVSLRANYGRTETRTQTATTSTHDVNADLWLIGLRYERIFTERFNGFAEYSIESDITRDYIQKNNADIGAKYFLINTEPTKWFVEGGYRYIVMDFAPGINTQYISAARTYTEAEHVLTDTSTGKVFVEYVQNLTSPRVAGVTMNRAGYTFTFEPSIAVRLNGFLSLKTSWNYREEETPNNFGKKSAAINRTLSTALMAKF